MMLLAKHENTIIGALRKASRDGTFVIPCGSLSAARASRAQAYALVKKLSKYVGKHTELDALNIFEEVSAVSMSISPAFELVMRRKDQTAGIMAMEAALAASGEVVKDVNEEGAAASFERLQRLVGEGNDPQGN
jgi:hypothetical protein